MVSFLRGGTSLVRGPNKYSPSYTRLIYSLGESIGHRTSGLSLLRVFKPEHSLGSKPQPPCSAKGEFSKFGQPRKPRLSAREIPVSPEVPSPRILKACKGCYTPDLPDKYETPLSSVISRAALSWTGTMAQPICKVKVTGNATHREELFPDRTGILRTHGSI